MNPAEISIRRAALILACVLSALPWSVRAAKKEAGDPNATTVSGGDVVVPSLSKERTKRRSRRANRFDAYAFVSSYYDDNVFDYSDADRARFDAATTPLSRFPISDLSDVVTRVAGRGSYLWKVRRRSYWRARLSYDGRLYANNGDKTYHELGVSLRRKKRRGSFELRAGYTPEYYLRHLFWRASLAPPPGVRHADLCLRSRYAHAGRRSGRRPARRSRTPKHPMGNAAAYRTRPGLQARAGDSAVRPYRSPPPAGFMPVQQDRSVPPARHAAPAAAASPAGRSR